MALCHSFKVDLKAEAQHQINGLPEPVLFVTTSDSNPSDITPAQWQATSGDWNFVKKQAKSDPKSKVNAYIHKNFGRPVTISGADLDKAVARELKASAELLKAASK